MLQNPDSRIPTHIVVQVGYAIWGRGNSRDEAVSDAVQWLDEPSEPWTVERLEGRLNHDSPSCVGQMAVLDASDPDFSDYLKNDPS